VGCQLAGGEPGQGEGACVLERCRNDVSFYNREVCERAPTQEARNECLASIEPCAMAGEQCKFLACIDASIGNVSDARIRMVGK
jgi:5'-nucleotidase